MVDNTAVSRTSSIRSFFSRKIRSRSYVNDIQVDAFPVLSQLKEPEVTVEALDDDEDDKPRTQLLSVQDPRKKSSAEANKPLPYRAPVREKQPGSYMFAAPPTLIRTPWELQRNRRPAAQCARQPTDAPPMYSRKFDELPTEVLHLIVERLVQSHSSRGSTDVSGLQDDLCALSKTSKQCRRIATRYLYDEIWLPSNEGERGRRLSMIERRPSPLYHLKRTLEHSPILARKVRQLRVSYALSSEIFDQSSSIACEHGDASVALIARVVKLCPNLEHISGFSAPDLAGNKDVWRVLASRPMLKSHAWTLDLDWEFDSRKLIALHSGWQNLETLAISDTQLGTGTLFGTLRFLPNLKHLVLRGLFGSGIHCGTLMMLPALESLRLEALDGIADDGLEKLAYSKIAFSLERLVLVDMNVQSMTTIQTLLEGMQQLKRLALVQANPPELEVTFKTEETANSITLSSFTLEELCWDTDIPGKAVSAIANSISHGSLPALRKVSIPCDDDGEVQSVCRPIAQEGDLTSTDVHVLQNLRTSNLSNDRTLQLAQTLAQLRTLQSSRRNSVDLVVQDEDEVVQQMDVVGCYLGDSTSRVEYSLEPGLPGCRSVVPEFYEVLLPATRHGHEQIFDLQMLF